jgi:hypothetical protein
MHKALAWASAVACILFGISSAAAATADPASIAKDVANGIGVVKTTNIGSIGAPIIIFEEFHGSRVGDLQQSIALSRLLNKYNLQDIGLEGYVQGTQKLSLEWLKTNSAISSDARFGVALALLKQGEITSAEFMMIAFNTQLSPIEQSADRVAPADQEKAQVAPIIVVLTVAQQDFINNRASKSQTDLAKFVDLYKK